MSSVPEEDRLEKFSSTKTISLLKVIRENAEAMEKGIRMIVFVDERATAVALAQILNTANNPNIRADSVVGVAPGCNGISAKLVAKVGLRSPAKKCCSLLARILWPLYYRLFFQLQSAKKQQLETIKSFRAGIVNVMVATSVLEEGS